MSPKEFIVNYSELAAYAVLLGLTEPEFLQIHLPNRIIFIREHYVRVVRISPTEDTRIPYPITLEQFKEMLL